jgi:hypothetical protein
MLQRTASHRLERSPSRTPTLDQHLFSIFLYIHLYIHRGYHKKYRKYASHRAANKEITSCIQFPFHALNSLSILFHVYVGSIFLRDIFGKEQLISEIYYDVTRLSRRRHVYRFMWCFLPRFCNPCYTAKKVKWTVQTRGKMALLLTQHDWVLWKGKA